MAHKLAENYNRFFGKKLLIEENEDLSNLSDIELLKKYEKLENEYEAEMSMDGSGELGHKIEKDFDEPFSKFEREFEKRNIQIEDFLDADGNLKEQELSENEWDDEYEREYETHDDEFDVSSISPGVADDLRTGIWDFVYEATQKNASKEEITDSIMQILDEALVDTDIN